MTKIRTGALVFDQGNTLIMDPFQKVMELEKDEFRKLFADHRISIDTPKVIEAWTRANKEVDYPDIGHFFQEEPIIQEALRHLGIPAEVAAFLGLELLKEYRTGLKAVIESDPRTQEVRRTLQELKASGKRLGVFSNDRAVSLGMVLSHMGIEHLFEYIETSESIGIEKPDLRVFDHLLAHFGLPPHRVAYVGDDPIRDIDPAKAKGLKAILHSVDGALYGEAWRDYSAATKYKPDAVIKDFAELLEIIG